MTNKKSPRKALVRALQYCVESLAVLPLMETQGAIKEAISVCPEIWDGLNNQARAALTVGIGLTDPTPPTEEE